MAYRKTSGAPGSTKQFAPEYKSPKQAEEEAQQLLAAFGGRIMQMLKAGAQKLDGMDRAYAQAVSDKFGGGGMYETSRATPLADIMGSLDTDDDIKAKVLARAIEAGTLGANVASRYALPAGAAMLGAKGLADITGGIYDMASDQPII